MECRLLRLIRERGNLEKMEPYYSLMLSFGLNTISSENLVDIVGKLPEEISIMILR
jgi:hypothetical protein